MGALFWSQMDLGEVRFVVGYRNFYNPFAFVVSALIFLH